MTPASKNEETRKTILLKTVFHPELPCNSLI